KGAVQAHRDHRHKEGADSHDHAHGGFETVVLRSDRPLRPDLLAAWLDALPTSVFRAKGFVRFADAEATKVLHVVGARRSLEQGVDQKEIDGAALVVIGRDLDINALQTSLLRCAA